MLLQRLQKCIERKAERGEKLEEKMEGDRFFSEFWDQSEAQLLRRNTLHTHTYSVCATLLARCSYSSYGTANVKLWKHSVWTHIYEFWQTTVPPSQCLTRIVAIVQKKRHSVWWYPSLNVFVFTGTVYLLHPSRMCRQKEMPKLYACECSESLKCWNISSQTEGPIHVKGLYYITRYVFVQNN